MFEFVLPFQEEIEFVVRYQVDGNEVWDNNAGGNYQINSDD